MPINLLMPAISPTMEKGNLTKWLKKEGDAIKPGDVIAEVDTEKATMEVEAVDEGMLVKILVPEGTNDVAVNTPIATILSDDEFRLLRQKENPVLAPYVGAVEGRAGVETLRHDYSVFLFVSHVSEDRAVALQVVHELECRNLRCWIAPRDVHAGKPFDDEIADAIEGSQAFLLIFSDRCNERDYIRREVTVAGDAHKLIIPFRIENARPKRGLSVRLADLHWIDGFVSQEKAIEDVLRAIRTEVNRGQTGSKAESVD